MMSVQRIPTWILALAIAIVIEMTLLVIGDFQLGFGEFGPDNGFLFLTHLLAFLILWAFLAIFQHPLMIIVTIIDSNFPWLLVKFENFYVFEIFVVLMNLSFIWAFLTFLIRLFRKRRAARMADTPVPRES